MHDLLHTAGWRMVGKVLRQVVGVHLRVLMHVIPSRHRLRQYVLPSHHRAVRHGLRVAVRHDDLHRLRRHAVVRVLMLMLVLHVRVCSVRGVRVLCLSDRVGVHLRCVLLLLVGCLRLRHRLRLCRGGRVLL